MPVDPINANDICQVIIGTRLFGQQCLNVLYFRSKGSQALVPYVDAIENLATRVISDAVTSIVEPMRLATTAELDFEFVQVQRVYPVRSLPIRITLDAEGIAETGACPTANIAAVVTKQGETVGRGRSGSFHLAGIGAGGIVQGELTGEQLGLMDDLLIALRLEQDSTTVDVTWEPGMFNPSLGAGLNWNPITHTRAEATARVMRRRTVGLGI